MNDHNPDFDPRLAELFRREHTHLPPEPFSSVTLRALAAERKRAVLRTRLMQAAAVIVLVLLAPRIAAQLDPLLARASDWLASPLGLASAALCVLIALATKWARVW
jgi:hypothetical protein